MPTEPATTDRARLGPVRRTVREVGLALVTLGVVVLAFVAYQLFGTGFTEQHGQQSLAHSFAQASRAAHATTTGGSGGSDGATVGGSGAASLSPSTPTGAAVAHIVIPKIGVDKFVVQGTGEAQLSEGPGHYVDTPMPGQAGNVGIAGHRTTYGAPFFRLNELTDGSPIYITVPSGRTFTYRVTGQQVVSPGDVSVLDFSRKAVLTLTTCTPRFTATSRLVVDASLVGSPVAATTTAAVGRRGAELTRVLWSLSRNRWGKTTTEPASVGWGQGAGALDAVLGTPDRKDSGQTSREPGGVAGARPAGTVRPAPGPQPPVQLDAAPAGGLASGDSAAWPPTLAWGGAFVILWVLTRIFVARARRWRRAGTFVLGVAICLIPLWFCFENVVRLLPASV